MARPSSSAEDAAAGPHHIVFIDTSLDTHLALEVSDSETVSQLKKKIIQAHGLCFPKLGEIKIDAVKVKRRGHSYHLFDSMLVTTAFHQGVKKDWFLFVDASTPIERPPVAAIAYEPSKAVVEIGGSHNVNETVDVLQNGSEAKKDLMVAFEEGNAVNSSGETMLPALKRPNLRNGGSPSESIQSKKRRKIERKKANSPISADATLTPGNDVQKQIHERTIKVDKRVDVTELEKAIVIRSGQIASSDASDRIEKADHGLVHRASESAANSVEGNGSSPLLLKEVDVRLNADENAALTNNPASGTGRLDNDELLQGNDVNMGDKEVSLAHPADTEQTLKNTVTPRKRKKGPRTKSSAGEKLEILNQENDEHAPGDDSLVEPQQAANVDQSEGTLNEENNLAEAEGKEITVMDASERPGMEHGFDIGRSSEFAENADIVGEKTKKSTKRRASKGKNIDETNDGSMQEQNGQSVVDKNELTLRDGNEKSGEEHENELRSSREVAEAENIMQKTKKRIKKRSLKEKSADQTNDRLDRAEVKESESMAPDQNSNKDRTDEMGMLQHMVEKAEVEHNVEEKIQKKKARKRGSKEKHDQSSGGIVDEQSFISQAEGRDTLAVDVDGEDHSSGRVQPLQIIEKPADSSNLEEKSKKMMASRSSKEKNANRNDEGEGNFFRAGEAEKMATEAAENETYDQNGNELEESYQVTGISANEDKGKGRRRKKSRRPSLKEDNFNQSSDRIDKEEGSFHPADGGEAVAPVAAEDTSHEPNEHEMDQSRQVTEKSAHENIGKQKRRKKTMRRSSREMNADESSDKIDKSQNYISQAEEVLMDGNKNSEGEPGNEGQSSPHVIEKPAEADREGSKNKDIDQSGDVTLKEIEIRSQDPDAKETDLINADKSSNPDHAGNNEENAGRITKSKRSSKKSIQPNREAQDLSSSHNTIKEDANNLGNSATTAKGRKLEATSTMSETNDQGLKVRRKAKVASGVANDANSSLAPVQSSQANNNADNILPDSHIDEANNSMDESRSRENINFRSYFTRRQSQQEVAASVHSSVDEGPMENRSGSNPKVKIGKRKAASSALTGPHQLSEPIVEENSAASASGMKRLNNTKRASKSNSDVDRFRVAIRKPLGKNLGEAVNGLGGKKSLLSLAGAIFKEESSGSSKHEGAENSDASTRTPSDNFSDYSESDSDVNFNTPDNGCRRDEVHRKDKSSFKDAKSLSMDKILRSSSGYKKARLAAESQLDDSEPTEFVPDSQANT